MSVKTTDVFGINRDLPLNYVERSHVDDRLIESLTHERHIVIHGSSKQGKTCLRKKCLADKDYVLIQCSNKWTLAQLNSAILKQAGYEIALSQAKTASGRNKLSATARVGFLGNTIGGDADIEDATSETITTKPIELDPEDVNEIIAALKALDFDRYILLEDFHYLPAETQRDFAVALKAFHEASDFCFVVVGVWLEENRLIVLNGDLTGRVASINADHWEKRDLSQVVSNGEKLLNITFDDDFVSAAIGSAEESVYLVQEACRIACETAGVHATQDEPRVVGAGVDVQELIGKIVDLQSARYRAFIINFAEGFQATDLQMYRWLLYPIIVAGDSDLTKGLQLSAMKKLITEHHPQGKNLNYGNLTQALQSTASLQVKKEIKPIVIDYDQTNLRLSVVDRGFLVWIRYQDVDELLEMAGLPLGIRPA